MIDQQPTEQVYWKKADKLLEGIPVAARIGDDWNEIQAALRDMEESEDVQADLKRLIPRLEAFIKTRKLLAN